MRRDEEKGRCIRGLSGDGPVGRACEGRLNSIGGNRLEWNGPGLK
jgi:hypothetical protein